MRVKIDKKEESAEVINIKPEPEIAPKFSDTQRLAIREAQFQSMKLRDQARQLIEQAQVIDQQVATFINKAAADLKVDPKKYSFSVDTINFYPVEKK